MFVLRFFFLRYLYVVAEYVNRFTHLILFYSPLFLLKNNCLTLVNDSDTPQFTNKHLHLSCTELLQLLLQEKVLLILIVLPLNFAY